MKVYIEAEMVVVDRGDSHNASVNKELAAAGMCGMTHLASGRVCVRPARHQGSCDFRTREEADVLLAGGRPVGTGAQQGAAREAAGHEDRLVSAGH